MNKYNKKRGTQKREREVVNCCNKLKRDYISPIDLMDFFAEEYLIQQDKECRKNLEQISKSLCEITIAKGDN